MRSLALTLAVLLSAAAGADEPRLRAGRGRLGRAGDAASIASVTAIPFFEFATASGVGMGAACACAPITGTKGEPSVFTRASPGTCDKSVNGFTGIAVGDLVECPADMPRVYTGDGGTLKVGVANASRTNWVKDNERLDSASWSSANSGAAAITVTADYATAPCGVADGGACFSAAERLQIPATSGSQYTIRYQAGCSTGGARSAAFYICGNAGTTGTIDHWIVTSAAPTLATATCDYPACPLYNRCVNENVAVSAVGNLSIGNGSAQNGGISRPAADVSVWGPTCESEVSNGVGQNAATVGPFIATRTAAEATMAREFLDWPMALSGLTEFSFSVTVTSRGPTATDQTFAFLGDGTPGDGGAPSTYARLAISSANHSLGLSTANFVDAGIATITPFFEPAEDVAQLHAAYHTGVSIGACESGICADDPPFTTRPSYFASTLGSPVITRFGIGHFGTEATGYNGLYGQGRVALTAAGARPTFTGSSLWIGHSVIYGIASLPWTPYKQLSTMLGRNIQGAGYAGDTVAMCLARWNSLYLPQGFQSVIWGDCAVNDIIGGAGGAATAVAAKAALDSIKASGVQRITVTGISPWKAYGSWTAPKQVETAAYNAAISNYAADAGWKYVSFAAMGGEGADPDALLAADSFDGLHLTKIGATAMAAIVADAGQP